MPELPEVETIKRQLDKELVGKKIKLINVLRDKSFSGDMSDVLGRAIRRVSRRAKVVEVEFAKSESVVIIHLKMTGQLVYVDDKKRLVGGHPAIDWVGRLPSSHTRVIWEFDDGSKLYFNDMRVFGWMRVVKRDWYEEEKKRKAPDVIDKEFDFDYLKSVLKKSGRAVKLVLTDQEKIGGVGNIYANDALYLSKIYPGRKANSLTDIEIEHLRKAVVEVINKGIKYGGSSAADEKFVNTLGQKGRYQEHFLVYERSGKECSRDGGLIKKIRIGGRSAFYCPECQK